jgi:hypothetical protein
MERGQFGLEPKIDVDHTEVAIHLKTSRQADAATGSDNHGQVAVDGATVGVGIVVIWRTLRTVDGALVRCFSSSDAGCCPRRGRAGRIW